MCIAQGTADVTVRPAITLRFAKQLCAAGTPVVLTQMKGVSHRWIAEKSAHQAIKWMADRFAGRPVPSDCGH